MKGRPRNIRKISFMPTVSGFRPYGENVKNSDNKCVFLFYEEYEALRLNDYEKHTHCESAAIMQVSRPTFTRIYMSAREKIAKAFIEGLRIVIEGGKVELDGNWYVCQKCKAVFSTEHGEAACCALCGSKDIQPYQIGPDEEAVPEAEIPASGTQGSTLQSTAIRYRGGCQRAGKKRLCRKNATAPGNNLPDEPEK